MKTLVFFLLLISLKPVYSRALVNLRTREISPTIRVAHGYFTLHGRYKMLVGLEEPITLVLYGSDQIFVQPETENPQEECFVELFERSNFIYVIVTVFERKERELEFRSRTYYTQGHLHLRKIAKGDFIETISSEIFLFFDIKSAHKHPFMAKTSRFLGMDKEVTYTIAQDYKGLKINEQDDIQYAFGIAYDDTTPIVVGYRVMDEFMTAFDSVILTYRVMLITITFKNAGKVVVYQRARHLTKSVWNAVVHHPLDFMDIVKYHAYQTANTLRSKNIEFDPVTLDVTENISPELFGIEITEGRADDWDYKVYRVENENREHFKIIRVIDMLCENLLVMNTREDALETIVETYRKQERCTIVVTSFMRGLHGEFKERRIFDRKTRQGVFRYQEVLGNVKVATQLKLDTLQPILVRIPIDKGETSIYSRDRFETKDGVYIKFSINPPDARAIEHPGKYRIGRLSQRIIHDQGNIPHCPYGEKRIFFTNNLRIMNAIVANTQVPMELEHMDPELYTTVYRQEVIYA